MQDVGSRDSCRDDSACLYAKIVKKKVWEEQEKHRSYTSLVLLQKIVSLASGRDGGRPAAECLGAPIRLIAGSFP